MRVLIFANNIHDLRRKAAEMFPSRKVENIEYVRSTVLDRQIEYAVTFAKV